MKVHPLYALACLVAACASGTDSVEDRDGAARDARAADAPDAAGVREIDAAVPPLQLSDAPVGAWAYVEVEGSYCRDGSPAGYYIKRSAKAKDLMIFLNGGGVCYDDFFCAINPATRQTSLPGETLPFATLDIVSGLLVDVPQTPPEDGIFKEDPRNPVADWSQVFVPYCTGDAYGGTRRDAIVSTAVLVEPQQFVGYDNLGLFLRSFGPLFKRAAKVLLTGSSAGGIGTLLNYDRTQEYFSASRVFAISDSGIPFRDLLYDGSIGIETCLQKNWRELWGLNDAFPKGCAGCFDPSGGKIVDGLGHYIFHEKYPRRMLGGGISSAHDEIMQLFFSGGLNDCESLSGGLDAVAQFLGLSGYPQERFPKGLKDFISEVAGDDRVGSYVMDGSNHMHLFRPRFYEQNGVGMTIADWVRDILNEKPTHVGSQFLPQ